MKFFISYNHSDKKLALDIADILTRNGVTFFLDEKGISYGDDIVDQVSKNLRDSTHMAVIISPGSLKSAWVPYEIGFARANGLKIIPVLQHPAIDIPGYIRNLKYCKDIEEFSTYVIEAYEGDLIVDITLKAGEMVLIDETHIVFAVHNIDDGMEAGDIATPALMIEVRNRMGREIELDNPTISFKKPQKGIITNEEVEGIGTPFTLSQKHVVSPNGKTVFYFYHPGNTKSSNSIMLGIINAFLSNNIESINIETRDGIRKILRGESIHNISDLVKYYRQRFPSYCKDLA